MNIKIKTETIEKKVFVTKEVEVKHVEINGKTFTTPTLKCTSYSTCGSSYYILNYSGYTNQTSLTQLEFDEIKRLYPDIEVIERWID